MHIRRDTLRTASKAGMDRRVHVFLNHASGAGAGGRERLSPQRLAESFHALDCACTVSALKETDPRELAAALPPGVDFVAAGGDGTVNAVAGAVAQTGRRMGVLALGTLNHFARDCGLPLDFEAGVRAIAAGHSRAVDACSVNGTVFVNNSSLGAYPSMVSEREQMKRGGWNKWISLTVASMRQFVRFRKLHVELESGRTDVTGEAIHLRRCSTPFVFIGNNPYCVDGLRVGSRERVDTGRLALYLAPGASRMAILRMALRAIAGRASAAQEFEQFELERAIVSLRKRGPRVSYDGEVKRMRAPLEYRILPGAIQLLCPAEPAQ